MNAEGTKKKIVRTEDLIGRLKKRSVVKEQGSSVLAKLSQQLILRTESTYIDSSLLGHSAQPTVMVQTGSRHSVVNPLVFLQQV